jgi:hypothetical protein
MKRILPVFWAVCVWAQSGIEVPAVGTMVDPSGALRPVLGLAGNFLLGPATVSGVLSVACSQRLCLAKTDSKILSATGETDAPPGPAIFGLGAVDAVVYFPESRMFADWHDDTLELLDWEVDGEVLSIRFHGGEAEIAVRRDQDIWIVHPDGSVIDWIVSTAGPVLLLVEGVLFATDTEVVLRRPDWSEVRFDLTSAVSITAMGPHYAAIHAGNATYALRTESGRESLFLLPAFQESVP